MAWIEINIFGMFLILAQNDNFCAKWTKFRSSKHLTELKLIQLSQLEKF